LPVSVQALSLQVVAVSVPVSVPMVAVPEPVRVPLVAVGSGHGWPQE